MSSLILPGQAGKIGMTLPSVARALTDLSLKYTAVDENLVVPFDSGGDQHPRIGVELHLADPTTLRVTSVLQPGSALLAAPWRFEELNRVNQRAVRGTFFFDDDMLAHRTMWDLEVFGGEAQHLIATAVDHGAKAVLAAWRALAERSERETAPTAGEAS